MPWITIIGLQLLVVTITAIVGRGGDRHATQAASIITFGMIGMIGPVGLSSLYLRRTSMSRRFREQNPHADGTVVAIDVEGIQGDSGYKRLAVVDFATADGAIVRVRSNATYRTLAKGDKLGLHYRASDPSDVVLDGNGVPRWALVAAASVAGLTGLMGLGCLTYGLTMLA